MSVGFMSKAQKQPVTYSLKPQSILLPGSELLRPHSFPLPCMESFLVKIKGYLNCLALTFTRGILKSKPN